MQILSSIFRYTKVIFGFIFKRIKAAWKAYEVNNRRISQEKAYYAQKEQEGIAFGRGIERGRIEARNEFYETRNYQRNQNRIFRDVTNFNINDPFDDKKKRKRLF
jgi:hypothetical protein